MTSLTTIDTPQSFQTIAQAVVQTLPSKHSRRAYSREIARYLETGLPFDRLHIQAYLNEKRDSGLSTSSLVVTMAALRLLASELNLRGILPNEVVSSINLITVKNNGRKRTGTWLTKEQCIDVIKATGTTNEGIRNQAIISLLIGCGLRREEVTKLQWSQIQTRQSRPVIADLTRKRNKTGCIVPIPKWAFDYVERWRVASDATDGPIFGLDDETIYYIVKRAGDLAGLDISPHDLRRTCAELMLEAGADLIQVQRTLDHASVATTQRYLADKPILALGKAGVDLIDLAN